MSVEIDTSELDGLAVELTTAAVRITADVESKALTEVARQMRTDAVNAAPRDTGELAGSIYIRGGLGYRIVGSDVKQGFFQEHGTSVMPPQPWMYPAAGAASRSLARILGDIADPLP